MRGIMFKQSLFTYVIEGYKTETRREGSFSKLINSRPIDFVWRSNVEAKGKLFRQFFDTKKRKVEFVRPEYQVGEIVYLKEPTAETEFGIKYRYGDGANRDNRELIWLNKMFAGIDRSRFFIKITKVWHERLLDISPSSVVREGVDRQSLHKNLINAKNAKEYYLRLYAEVYKQDQEVLRKQNPYLWCYELKLVTDLNEIVQALNMEEKIKFKPENFLTDYDNFRHGT